ncbi:MAG TPA: hypothetical protein VMB73_26625 [Acetobacteraceae bacterium]|jgi:hypothetical protein|nr:hypothetical protein [Acetobacteraceae bacterium]
MEHERKSQVLEVPARIRARAARYRDYARILSGHDDAQRGVLGLADELDALADRVERRVPAAMEDGSPD